MNEPQEPHVPRESQAPRESQEPQAPVDETVVVSEPAQSERNDETIAMPRARARELNDATVASRSRSRSLSRNPAPPVEEPAPLELPPELAARMFKSPLDARYRVPEAPTPAPDHALPRRGVSPAMPVLTSQRSGRRVASGADTDANFGPPPESRPAPPAADRAGVRSTARANRRFGIGAVAGFAGSLLVAIGGLWFVAVLAFG